jgi:tetratricopeptide (TPR) repeat protein
MNSRLLLRLPFWLPSLAAIAWFGLAPSGRAQNPPAGPTPSATVVAARESAARFDVRRTIVLYEQAIREASPGDAASLRLEFAGLLGRAAQRSDAEPDWLSRSEREFRTVLETASGNLLFQAANNFASQMIRFSRASEAVQIIGSVTNSPAWKELPGSGRSRCLFTLGRALETLGRREEAYGSYLRASAADPTFDRAANSARALALGSASEGTGIPQIVRLVNEQLRQRDFPGAARSLRDALTTVPHWQPHPRYPDLVEGLLRYFTEAAVDREGYRSNWSESLKGVPRENLVPVASRLLSVIDRVFTTELPIEFSPAKAESGLAAGLAPETRRVLSRFLAGIGAQNYRARALRPALGAYSHAWALDTTNLEAGLYAANILLVDGDPGAGQRLDEGGVILKSFVRELFDEKGQEYRRQVGTDWGRLVKFHTILGTIFEKQQQWGDESRMDGAIFQWQMARRALDRLPKTDNAALRSAPWVDERLAVAFKGARRPKDALASELRAAEGFNKAGRRVEGHEALIRAMSAPEETLKVYQADVVRIRKLYE